MGALAAAYNLGLNTLMMRYHVRYYARYPWDPLARDSGGLSDFLSRITEDLSELTPEIGNPASASEIRRTVAEAHRSLAADGLGHGADEMDITTSVRQSWLALGTRASELLRNRPTFYPWFRLGRSVAFCFLDVLDEHRTQILPSLTRVIRASVDLPEARTERVEILRRLASADPTSAASNPLEVLRKVLDEAHGNLREVAVTENFDLTAPFAAAPHKVQKLNLRLQAELLTLERRNKRTGAAVGLG